MKFAQTEAAIKLIRGPVWAIRSIQQKKCKHATLDVFLYIHLDKAKVATLARLKPSPDVIKRDKRRGLNVERNITMLKTARFRSHARQLKSLTCIKFDSATTWREERKLRRFLEEKLDAFLSIGNHAKPPKKRTRPPLHCFAYRKEAECVCDLIVFKNCLYIRHSAMRHGVHESL